MNLKVKILNWFKRPAETEIDSICGCSEDIKHPKDLCDFCKKDFELFLNRLEEDSIEVEN